MAVSGGASARRIGFWASLTAVIVAIFVTWLLPAIRDARQAAERSQRSNNLRQVGLALSNWDGVWHRLPTPVTRDKEGRALCSWRLALWPYLEAAMIQYDLDKPWDAPENRWLVDEGHPVYCWSLHDAPGATTVMAITGRGTAFDESRRLALSELPDDTILIVEVAHCGVPWIAPGDIDVDDLPPSLAEGVDGLGVLVLFADGEVWHLKPDTPLDELKKFCTIEGAKKHDRQEVLARYGDRLR